jgi:hypothetical protein
MGEATLHFIISPDRMDVDYAAAKMGNFELFFAALGPWTPEAPTMNVHVRRVGTKELLHFQTVNEATYWIRRRNREVDKEAVLSGKGIYHGDTPQA